MSDSTPESLARDSLAKGKFRFIDAIQGRTYPEEEVAIYLDEAAVVPLLAIDAKVKEAKRKVENLYVQLNTKVVDPETFKKTLAVFEQDVVDLEAEKTALTEKLRAQRYVLTIRGFDAGFITSALEKSKESYPVEYDEYLNPVSGRKENIELVNPQRDRLYTNLLWQGHIVRITDSAGNVDEKPDLETVAALRMVIPIASRVHVEEAIDKVQLSVDWYDALADEVFSQKS